MTEFTVSKVLDALPNELTPSTLYFVRTGPGFDIYLTDKRTPATATRLNGTVVDKGDIQSWWDNSSDKTKLDGVAAGATKNATDVQLRDRTTHTGEQPISSVTGLQTALDSKVDKVSGKQLSTEDFTSALKDKLIGLEGTHWRGTFVSLAALQAAVADPAAGDYADVDAVGADVARYIWDATDSVWVALSGVVAPVTAPQVKQLYESNPDTNAFTDADEAKLGGIEAGAQVNTVTSVNSRTGAVTGLVENADERLSDSREWTAETVSQAEAEAGTATTARKWTAQRVRQAIAAWWSGSAEKAKLDGLATGATKNDTDANLKNRANHTGTQVISTVSGLQSALDSKAASDHSHSVATTSADGFMSAADKTKLNGIAAGASAYSLPDSAPTVSGGVKTRLEETTLYMTNNGTNP